MFVMKRSRDNISSSEESSSKRREVTFYYKKWMTELDCSCQTVSWLHCETRFIGGKRVVAKLKCNKHFSNKCIEGADSIRTIIKYGST